MSIYTLVLQCKRLLVRTNIILRCLLTLLTKLMTRVSSFVCSTYISHIMATCWHRSDITVSLRSSLLHKQQLSLRYRDLDSGYYKRCATAV